MIRQLKMTENVTILQTLKNQQVLALLIIVWIRLLIDLKNKLT